MDIGNTARAFERMCFNNFAFFLTKSTNLPGCACILWRELTRALAHTHARTILARAPHTDASRSNNKARDISSAALAAEPQPQPHRGPPAAETCVNIIFLTRHSTGRALAPVCYFNNCAREMQNTHTH